jgi:hypothetical protein
MIPAGTGSVKIVSSVPFEKTFCHFSLSDLGDFPCQTWATLRRAAKT